MSIDLDELTHPLDSSSTIKKNGSPQSALAGGTSNALNLPIPLTVPYGGTNTTSYTAGSVIFAGAGGTTLTQNNGQLFWDNTNDALCVGTTTFKAPLTVQGTGGTTFASCVVSYFGSVVTATAGNIYQAIVDKNSIESLMLGVNKNTSTGVNVPSNAAFISTFTAGGQISIGRGAAGLPNNADILIDSSGNVSVNSGNLKVANLTASTAVFTDASSNLTSTGVVSVAHGGTGSSSYTAGSVIFAGAGGTTLAQNNGKLFWDNVGNSLYIGTNPSTPSPSLVASGGLILYGTNSTNAASQAFYVTGDQYPLLQILPFTHNNVNLTFDSYWTGSTWISSATTSFQIRKETGVLTIYYAATAGAGTTIAPWIAALQVSSTGNVKVVNLSASTPVFTDASSNFTSTGVVSVAHGGTGLSSQVTNGVCFSTGSTITTDGNFTYSNVSGVANLTLNSNVNSNIFMSNTRSGGVTNITLTRPDTNSSAGISFLNNNQTVASWYLGMQPVGPITNNFAIYDSVTFQYALTVVSSTDDVQINSGNLAISTAGKGLQVTSAAVSGGTGNAMLVTNVKLTGGTVTVANSAITSSAFVGFAMRVTDSGTAGTYYKVIPSAGSFVVTSNSSGNASTLTVFFVAEL